VLDFVNADEALLVLSTAAFSGAADHRLPALAKTENDETESD
jgi:hypothetical protein